MNVHVLPDLKLLDAETSLAAVVERARSVQAFGPTVDFDTPVWALHDNKIARPSAGQTCNLYFTRITARETRSMEGRVAFEPAFGNLIKSVIALREYAAPIGAARHRKLLQAGRVLYETLEDRGFDPVRLNTDDFFAAAASIKGAKGYKYTLGQDLEVIAGFLNENGLSKVRITYTNPHTPHRFDMKTGEKAEKHRASKMPSEDLVDAVIAMSHLVREIGAEPDILRAAIVELLLCAPWRINETLMLLAGCVRRQNVTDPKTGTPYEALGFAYGGSKGADDNVKWVAPKMMEVAERAIADIDRITEPFREIARWMERHPGRAYLAEPFRLADPATQLSTTEVVRALGVKTKAGVSSWLKSNGVPVEKRDGICWCSLADVEAALLRLGPKLPANLPQKLSEYLFVVPQHFLRDDMNSQYAVMTFVNDFQIGSFLATHASHRSIFDRLKIHDADGEPYRITSKAFRHYLNTIAKGGELSELDIARWSGRKRIEQNAAYDHTGGRQLRKRAREMLETNAMQGSMAETVAALPPLEREEFIKARINTAHMTEIGACISDWSLAPCPKHGSCAGCGDHLVIKGNELHRARAERLLAEHESMLASAKAEMDEGTYGASNWVAHNEKMVAGLTKTIAVHTDPATPDGTIVQV
jgi:hypothetical protein